MEQPFHRMSRQKAPRIASPKVFDQRVRKYLISLTDEAEADRLMKQYQAELEICRKGQWRPETAGTAAYLGLLKEADI